MGSEYSDTHEPFGAPFLQRRSIGTLLIFRALQLGDMLCAVPALRALRVALPDARMTLVGLPGAERFAHRFHRYLDDFVAFPGHPWLPEQPVQEHQVARFYEAICARQADLALQMHGSGEISNEIVGAFGAKTIAGYTIDIGGHSDQEGFFPYPRTGSEIMRLLCLVELLGAPWVGEELEFPITEQDERELNDSGLNGSLDPGSYICIHPGARTVDKCWPPQRFAEVADRLADEFGLAIVLTGSAGEAALAETVKGYMGRKAINAAAPISIGAMAALISRSCLLVCNDTGVSHIAAALKLPSVVIFSRTDLGRWAPLDQELHRCIWDPNAESVGAVLEQARVLLRTRGVGTTR